MGKRQIINFTEALRFLIQSYISWSSIIIVIAVLFKAFMCLYLFIVVFVLENKFRAILTKMCHMLTIVYIV